MDLRKIQSKKAAMELSIGTVVIIVIAMTMLILGLVLVRNIFSFGTDSVETLGDGVRGEITNIFTEEGSKIAIRLGSNKLAKISAGGDEYGVSFGAQTRLGGSANTQNLRYRLELTNDDCRNFEDMVLDHEFSSTLNGNPATAEAQFDETDGETGRTILFFSIPDGTPECVQRIKIHTYDDDSKPDEIASSTFRVQVTSGGIFS